MRAPSDPGRQAIPNTSPPAPPEPRATCRCCAASQLGHVTTNSRRRKPSIWATRRSEIRANDPVGSSAPVLAGAPGTLVPSLRVMPRARVSVGCTETGHALSKRVPVSVRTVEESRRSGTLHTRLCTLHCGLCRLARATSGFHSRQMERLGGGAPDAASPGALCGANTAAEDPLASAGSVARPTSARSTASLKSRRRCFRRTASRASASKPSSRRPPARQLFYADCLD